MALSSFCFVLLALPVFFICFWVGYALGVFFVLFCRMQCVMFQFLIFVVPLFRSFLFRFLDSGPVSAVEWYGGGNASDGNDDTEFLLSSGWDATLRLWSIADGGGSAGGGSNNSSIRQPVPQARQLSVIKAHESVINNVTALGTQALTASQDQVDHRVASLALFSSWVTGSFVYHSFLSIAAALPLLVVCVSSSCLIICLTICLLLAFFVDLPFMGFALFVFIIVGSSDPHLHFSWWAGHFRCFSTRWHRCGFCF